MISRTDVRRLSTRSLLAGEIHPNERIILVNDVAGAGESTREETGEGIDALRALVSERHAILGGILLFGVVDDDAFRRYCTGLGVPAHWLVTARWQSYTPEVDCPGCKKGEALTPIGELG